MKPIPIVSRFLAARQTMPTLEILGLPLEGISAGLPSPRLRELSLINGGKLKRILSVVPLPSRRPLTPTFECDFTSTLMPAHYLKIQPLNP